ncbi:unnamed protein product, partial [Prorocentrum cordatum]
RSIQEATGRGAPGHRRAPRVAGPGLAPRGRHHQHRPRASRRARGAAGFRAAQRAAGEPRVFQGPVLHGASRVVPLFAASLAGRLAALRREGDVHLAVARHVEGRARGAAATVLAPRWQARGAAGTLSFRLRLRVDRPGDERRALGPEVEWGRLKAAVRAGVEAATGWRHEPRGREADVGVVALLGAGHLGLGVEAPEADRERGVPFPWSAVPRAGMDTHLAGAMAALAAEAAGPSGGRAVVDPACGLGTLLLAAARAWKSAANSEPYPRLRGGGRTRKTRAKMCTVGPRHQIGVGSGRVP